jgi:large subunit ribosomal protein L18
VRKKVSGSPERPRLAVHRSHKQIYVQAIDDLHGVTLAASSSLAKELASNLEGQKRDVARAVGKDIAQRLVGKGISAAVFDRGWYKYHGRVRALAEGAREGGLKF